MSSTGGGLERARGLLANYMREEGATEGEVAASLHNLIDYPLAVFAAQTLRDAADDYDSMGGLSHVGGNGPDAGSVLVPVGRLRKRADVIERGGSMGGQDADDALLLGIIRRVLADPDIFTIVEDSGIALIDSSWFDLSPDEMKAWRRAEGID